MIDENMHMDLVSLLFVTLFRDKNKPLKLKSLLESGAVVSLIVQNHTNYYHTTHESDTSWHIVAEYFHTDGTIMAKLSLPELNLVGKVTYSLHAAPLLGAYNIIIVQILIF